MVVLTVLSILVVALTVRMEVVQLQVLLVLDGGSAGGASEGGSGWWYSFKKSPSMIPWYVRRGIRMIQVFVLSTMIFQIGYQRGMMDYAQFPVDTQRSLIQSSLPMSSLSESEAKEFEHYQRLPEYKRVSKILIRIIDAAKKVLREDLSQLHPDNDSELIEKLQRGLKKLTSGEWQIVLFPLHEEANAFVSGLCPRMVFVYTGLLRKTHATDDEIAMILGHELSHAILSHTEEKSDLDAYLIAIQLMILTLIDPLGFSSLLFDYFTNSLRNLFNAGFSRDEETEADALGLRIMATACYDITRGVGIMQKLAMLKEDIPIHPNHTYGHGTHGHITPTTTTSSEVVTPQLPSRQSTGWFDSHPSSTERFEKLNELAAELLAEFKDNQQTTATGVNGNSNGNKPKHTGVSSVVRTKPSHCYGLVADMEKAGFSWRFGF